MATLKNELFFVLDDPSLDQPMSKLVCVDMPVELMKVSICELIKEV